MKIIMRLINCQISSETMENLIRTETEVMVISLNNNTKNKLKTVPPIKVLSCSWNKYDTTQEKIGKLEKNKMKESVEKHTNSVP